MRSVSQSDTVAVLAPESRAIADSAEAPFGQVRFQLSLQYRCAESERDARRLPWSCGWLCDCTTVCRWRAVASSESMIGGFCPTLPSVFDTRLSSVTGSGLVRRPAALGLLLRGAPCRVSVPPKTNSLKTGHRTPREFLPVPSEKGRPSALGAGPTPVALPCVTRANSGIQNGEQKCI